MLRKLFLILLPCTLLFFSNPGEAKAQGWTFTETITQSGRCIPRPYYPMPPGGFYTQSACESARQSELSANGEDWSLLGDGNCTTIITCTPCVGGTTPPSGPTASTAGIPQPGAVSLEGLLAGRPFFSAHESRLVEELLNAYVQKMKSMGVTVDKNALLAAGEVPLTGDSGFDRYWVEQLLKLTTFKHGTAVNLSYSKGIVDPADLKQPEDKSVTTYKTQTEVAAPVVQIPGSGREYYHLEPIGIPPLPVSSGNGQFRYEHPRIELWREALVTGVGWIKGPAGYWAVFNVNLWAENAKAYQDYRDGNTPQELSTTIINVVEKTAKDMTTKAIGDVKGKAFDKVLDVAFQGTGIAEIVSTIDDYNSKWQDLGGKIAGGEGDGILGKLDKAAFWVFPKTPAGL